jgi:hypothetical protein
VALPQAGSGRHAGTYERVEHDIRTGGNGYDIRIRSNGAEGLTQGGYLSSHSICILSRARSQVIDCACSAISGR